MEESHEQPRKPVVKTLTVQLGKVRGWDNRANAKKIIALEDEVQHRVYKELPRISEDFGRLCNMMLAREYSRRILGVKKDDEDAEKYEPRKRYTKYVDKLKSGRMINGVILSQSYRYTNSHFAGEHGKELMARGSRQLSTHRTDGTHPIPFMDSGVRLEKDEEGYWLCLNVFSGEWSGENGVPAWLAFPIKIKPRDKTMAQQLQRVILTEWKLKTAQLQKNPRAGGGRKWLGGIVVEYTPDPWKKFDPGTVMGIDLGVNVPAVVHIRDNGTPCPWATGVGDGRSMLNTRGIVRGEIVRLIRALKRKPSLLQGPARDATLSRLRDLRKKETRILKTAAQKIAAQILEIARRNGAGTWQMEQLSAGLKEDKPWLSRNWAPGVVKDAVRWQAQQAGAELVFVDPAYTSQRCSKCGHIDRANRPKGKKGAAHFECVKCGYSDHADKNAARNVSTPGIAEIIAKKIGADSIV